MAYAPLIALGALALAFAFAPQDVPQQKRATPEHLSTPQHGVNTATMAPRDTPILNMTMKDCKDLGHRVVSSMLCSSGVACKPSSSSGSPVCITSMN